jgi:hypothetical protein
MPKDQRRLAGLTLVAWFTAFWLIFGVFWLVRGEWGAAATSFIFAAVWIVLTALVQLAVRRQRAKD